MGGVSCDAEPWSFGMHKWIMASVSTVIVVGLLLRVGFAADAATPAPAPPAADAVSELHDAVTAIRVDLAAMKLELQTAQRELREMREYLASADPQGDIQKWKTQSKAIDEERKQIAVERKRLDAAKQSLRDASRPPPPVAP